MPPPPPKKINPLARPLPTPSCSRESPNKISTCDANASKCTCPEKARVVKRDMATSPHLAPKSPTIKVSSADFPEPVVVLEAAARPYPEAQLPSPKVERGSRNAATSPRLDVKGKQRVLEKSNSLGEKKPQRVLRNTRSLSPRPPVKHQHAITVSDENDVVSVKLSPNDDFVEEAAASKCATPSPKKISQSERASPNVGGGLVYEDRFANNRSTGCLVYVPSDPWLRISDEEDTGATLGKKKKKKDTKRVEKSFSRPNIASLDDDPWIWKGPGGDAAARKNAYRQSKSLQSTAAEFSSLKLLPGKKEVARPKLQRSKSPICDPADDPKTLSVANHLLPRHSFSTSPTKRDEELQLNIRRLSEQMRPAYVTACQRASSPLPPPPPPPPVDPLLETTC